VSHRFSPLFLIPTDIFVCAGLYYVFPASATESVQADGKSFVKVGVDFPTGDALNEMGKFDYKGSEDVLALIDGWVQEHLPSVGKRIDSYCHPYTMTEDSYFVMDMVSDNVALFSGGSGRAFKFGPLIGDCMSSLLTGASSPVDLAPFSANRDSVRLFLEDARAEEKTPVAQE